jgi:hypothetical protein
MARRHDPERALGRVRVHLDGALEESTDPAVRYHLRQALQLADAVGTGLDGSTGSPPEDSATGSGADSGSGEA